LPRHVVTKIAAASTLLRAVVPDDDEALLWAPAPVDPARLPDVAFGPRWQLADALPSAAERAVVWGATDRAPPVDRHDDVEATADLPWRQLLLELPPPVVEIARKASDRRFAHDLAARLGVALPGATTIRTVEELSRHLADGGADAGASGAWVVKAPVTAAGRDRVRRRGDVLDAATVQRVRRLLERHGALVFEPWLERVLDIGQPGLVTGAAQWRLLPPHRLHSESGGGFAGITIAPSDTWLAAEHRRRLQEVAGAVARELGELGYRGPFTVDAFLHRDRRGAVELHPLAEINPRLTFGLVARAWAERAGAPLTLRVAEASPPPEAMALVRPTADDPTAAWLELGSA